MADPNELPEELADALERDPELAEAFHALTPGRQRSYLFHIAGAKQSKTRAARVERCRPKILAGRGMNEREGKPSPARTSGTPKLLSGGNPQIPKADGDAPVQAYIAAMPGWKRGVGRDLDALIAHAVPQVRKAVRWNTPFYGVEGKGWFLGFHCFAKYVKVTFLNGAALRPEPPERSKHENTRYLHIREDDALDEEQLASWVRQAARRPGEDLF